MSGIEVFEPVLNNFSLPNLLYSQLLYTIFIANISYKVIADYNYVVFLQNTIPRFVKKEILNHVI